MKKAGIEIVMNALRDDELKALFYKHHLHEKPVSNIEEIEVEMERRYIKIATLKNKIKDIKDGEQTTTRPNETEQGSPDSEGRGQEGDSQSF